MLECTLLTSVRHDPHLFQHIVDLFNSPLRLFLSEVLVGSAQVGKKPFDWLLADAEPEISQQHIAPTLDLLEDVLLQPRLIGQVGWKGL